MRVLLLEWQAGSVILRGSVLSAPHLRGLGERARPLHALALLVGHGSAVLAGSLPTKVGKADGTLIQLLETGRVTMPAPLCR